MAHLEGFEPTTNGIGIRYSIRTELKVHIVCHMADVGIKFIITQNKYEVSVFLSLEEIFSPMRIYTLHYTDKAEGSKH